MKLLNLFLLIFLWNTTYRCKKDELTIDCEDAAKNMIGTWKGNQSNNAKTFSDSFTLKVTSSDGCRFLGETSYSQSITTFNVSGVIDEYGWMEFNETNFIKVVITTLAITYANPHVYLDTLILLGSISVNFDSKFYFGLGAILASFVFFFSLGYFSNFLSQYIKSQKIWFYIDNIIGLLMLFYGLFFIFIS